MNNKNDYIEKVNELKYLVENFNQKNYKDKDFLEYLTLLNMKKYLKKFKIEASELEDKIYSYKNKALTDKERVLFEYKFIIKYIRENWKEIKRLPKKDINELICLFEDLSKIIKNDIEDEYIYKTKKLILKIQIKLNLNVTFYSIIDRMLFEQKNVGKEFKK